MDSTVIGRLLDEISWEGRRVRQYRGGGRGLENVLSAQVLQALDFLPRTAFLRPVLEHATGADTARRRVAAEAENLRLTFLPDQINLPEGVGVQADALLTGPHNQVPFDAKGPGRSSSPKGSRDGGDLVVLVEAKGPGRSSFNPEQLSREYRALLQQAGGRTPLLLLILGAEPPVKVKKRFGRRAIADALEWELRQLSDDVVGGAEGRERLVAGIPDVLAWTTWEQIAEVVDGALRRFTLRDASALAAVRRQAQGLLDVVAWHTRSGG